MKKSSKGWVQQEIERKTEARRRERKIKEIVQACILWGLWVWIAYLAGIAFARWLSGEG